MSSLEDAHLWFCPRCFASSDDGSWGLTCDDTYCNNCSSSGTVQLPDWAVQSIREQASWVGKRFYPHAEDHDSGDELRRLRRAMTSFPGRSAHHDDTLSDQWRVEQKRGGVTISVWVDADSAEDAIEKTKDRLPWCPEEGATMSKSSPAAMEGK